jgi:hypothetical protein
MEKVLFASSLRTRFLESWTWLTSVKRGFVPTLAGRSRSPEEREGLARAMPIVRHASPRKHERFDDLSTKIEVRQSIDPSSNRD